MATEFTLRRGDGKPFGSFEHVKKTIARLFPSVQFFWTTSGPEKLRIAKEKGIKFPAALRKVLKTLPSLLEGVAEGKDFHVTFGLGYDEPVQVLYVTPRDLSKGTSKKLQSGLDALEKAAGASFKVSGDE